MMGGISCTTARELPPGLGIIESEDACWAEIWAMRESQTFESSNMLIEGSAAPRTPCGKGDSEECLAAMSCLKYMNKEVFGTPATHFYAIDHQVRIFETRKNSALHTLCHSVRSIR
jgi:hypothetical protein